MFVPDKPGYRIIKNGLRRIAHKMGAEVFMLKRLPFGLNYLNDAMSMGKLIDPEIIFDVGANIGQTSVHLRNSFKSTKIYAFEPVGSTFQELTKNLSGVNVKAFNIGFGDQDERKRVFLQSSSGLNSLVDTLNEPNGDGVSEDVEITTVDNFCEANEIHSISLLKIDTEGFGLKVLNGARNLLNNAAVEAIFIEVGFDYQDKRHDNFCEVDKMLSAYSFRLMGFYDQWIENSRLEYCNALFILNERRILS